MRTRIGPGLFTGIWCVCLVATLSGERPHGLEPFAADTGLPPHVRTADCRIASAMAQGLARSATLQSQVERIGALKGIVYLDAGYLFRPGTTQVISGSLQHKILAAGEYRLLFIRVAPAPGPRLVEIVAHELQHAIEVLESNARTEADVDALYRAIGGPVGPGMTETAQALEAQRTVMREIAQPPGVQDAGARCRQSRLR